MIASDDTLALETVARARLLSVGFAPPTEDRLRVLERLAVGLGEEAVAAASSEADLTALSAEYQRLFGPAGVCPAYEGVYEPDPFRETRELADVAGFYTAFGAEASGPAHERPDHVGCELEFLAYLALRRTVHDGGSAAAETAAQAESAFLAAHLGRWLGRFCADVRAVTREPLYGALADAGVRFRERELAARGLQVEPVGAPRRRGRGVEQDELACGDGCAIAASERLLQVHGKALD